MYIPMQQQLFSKIWISMQAIAIAIVSAMHTLLQQVSDL